MTDPAAAKCELASVYRMADPMSSDAGWPLARAESGAVGNRGPDPGERREGGRRDRKRREP